MDTEKVYGRVLIINGSPNEHGSTYTALSEVRDALISEGIESEIVWVGREAVRGCVACRGCRTLGRCVFDDAVNTLAEKFRESDGLIVGSPVYYASPNGTLLSILDRLFFSTHFDKRMKVGAAVVSARRGGLTASFDVLNKYFAISEMPIAASSYWNQIHGQSAEEAKEDKEGLQIMRTLGRNVAFLIKSIKLGMKEYSLPESEPKVRTSFIR